MNLFLPKSKFILVILLGILLFSVHVSAQNHPNLILTKGGIAKIKSQLGNMPKFDATLAATIREVDEEIAKGIIVPIPKDLAGGYSHEVHKRNFFILQKAGVLFQLTGEEKYATYVKEIFLAYAELMPTIDRHPATRSYARGKFFWQCLNDANWLVYSSQAYDCIYDWLDKPTRKKLNKELFRPMADFLSVETPQFFNRIHNHSTWGNAAVGMIGIVMNDDELIQRALYGLNLNDVNNKGNDNDGGAIQITGQNRAGFLAQIDLAFSPDGYYTEGPYYQRYAMYPFLIFAQALANSKPELKIFEYRDGVLIKAVYALLVQTNTAGEFFPINDSVKGMSILSRELVTAVSLAYYFGGNDQKLLPFIEMQDRVPLNDSGVEAAMALAKGNYKAGKRESIELRDGANGDEGALGILRSSVKSDEACLVMKYTKQGMGHGHFDKLSFLYYHNNDEVFQDYGSARWVNIEQKDGGGYLKENTTWAKQTIAHNTLVVNNKSQYLGITKEADKHHSNPFLFKVNDKKVQVMSAKEENAYPGVQMHRTMAMITDDALEYPLVLDIYRVTASDNNKYDLPFYFQGQVMSTNFTYETNNVLKPMGKNHGYQHLWTEAKGVPTNNQASQLSWFNGKNFYTLTSNVNKGDSLIFGRIGANDPNYNLRRDPVFILRRTNATSTIFASTYEVHGEYSPVTEIAKNSYSKVKSVNILKNDTDYSVIQVQFLQGNSWVFALANKEDGKNKEHKIEVNNVHFEWRGAYKLFFKTLL